MNYNKLITKKNILITGGAGFVGSQLAYRLLKNNNVVHVLDNYFTGNTNNHIEGILYKRGETRDIFKYYKNISLDYIYHLGEYSRVEQSYEDIDLVMKYNLHPFYDVLKLAYHQQAKLIYSGSSTKFSDNLDLVESPYSFSKRMNTELLVKYANWYNLKYAITYFYNVYGSNEISKGKYATVIAKFLSLKNNNNDYLPITKPGTQRRRFTHIDDIVNGLILVGKKGMGDNYGIGADKSFTIIEIAKMLKMNYKMMPFKKGNRLNAKLKTSKTKKLGWRPTNNLKDYLSKNAQ
jgi:UDP-glucose 4-epimerase